MLSIYWDPNANIWKVHSHYNRIIATPQSQTLLEPIVKLAVQSTLPVPPSKYSSIQLYLSSETCEHTNAVPAPHLPPMHVILLSLLSLPVLCTWASLPSQLSSKCLSSHASGSYKDSYHLYCSYPRDLDRYELNWVGPQGKHLDSSTVPECKN